jgi:hypothetical protein
MEQSERTDLRQYRFTEVKLKYPHVKSKISRSFPNFFYIFKVFFSSHIFNIVVTGRIFDQLRLDQAKMAP